MDSKKKKSNLTKVIWILLLIGFAAMEFPGVFFINRIHPMILGMPFIHGFMIIMWAYMCIVLFIAYKTKWGKGAGCVEGEIGEDEGNNML